MSIFNFKDNIVHIIEPPPMQHQVPLILSFLAREGLKLQRFGLCYSVWLISVDNILVKGLILECSGVEIEERVKQTLLSPFCYTLTSIYKNNILWVCSGRLISLGYDDNTLLVWYKWYLGNSIHVAKWNSWYRETSQKSRNQIVNSMPQHDTPCATTRTSLCRHIPIMAFFKCFIFHFPCNVYG